MIEGRPVASEALTLSFDQFEGAGHKLENEWLLNLPGEIGTTVNFEAGNLRMRVTAFQPRPVTACSAAHEIEWPSNSARALRYQGGSR